jgi:hypothetical protein
MAPFGFREWRRLDGSAPTGGMEMLTIQSSDANPVFTGDPVATSANGPYIGGGSSLSGNGQIRGIFKGCEYYSATFARKVWSPSYPGSVGTTATTGDVQAWVVTDPEMLWLVQTSTGLGGTGGVQVTSTGVGMNFGFSSGTSSQGNATTGISAVTLNSTSIATTATLPFRLADMYSNWAPPGQNGTDNTTLGNFVIVAPNNWDRKNTTGI